jgi:hydrocephalus-inducing protein
MTYHLRVPGDGIGESICSTSEYDSNISESGSSVPPKEFEIMPNTGTLQPQSHTEIKVDICSNTMKKYDLSLVVDINGVGDEVLVVPISAK